MLTRLQLQIRQIVASLPDTEDLALAGGGALIVHGIVDRETRDLDFFCNSPEEVDRLLPSVEQALRDDSLVVERLRVAEGFAQLSVTSASETTTIDLAWDPRLLPPTVTPEGPVLAEEEVAAGKVLALFGRAEALKCCAMSCSDSIATRLAGPRNRRPDENRLPWGCRALQYAWRHPKGPVGRVRLPRIRGSARQPVGLRHWPCEANASARRSSRKRSMSEGR